MKLLMIPLVVLSLSLAGCGSGEPTPINYGSDQCENCKMNIVDKRFGAEVVTSTSKVYKFDSIECMSAYESQLAQSGEQSQSMWVVDYYVPESFLALPSSTIIRTKGIRSPMGLGFVAVASAADAAKFTTEYGGDILDWAQVSQVVRDAWSDGH